MAADYELRIKDTTGTDIARIVDYRRLDYTHRVNAPDSHAIIFDGNATFIPSIDIDYQVEVLRRLNPTIPFYLEYEGFHRTQLRQTTGKGQSLFTSFGVGYAHLLKRRGIWYPSGSAQAEKTGFGETVMKNFVDENAGPSATFPPRLLASGVTSGLTLQPTGGAGASWTGGRAYQNLLQVLQEIADVSAVDFQVVGVGAALFEFQAQATPIGDDRSVGNGAGNAPVTFSLDFANMAIPVLSFSRTAEASAVIVMGQGIGSDRTVVQRTNTITIDDSPWNRIEVSRGAVNESATAGLNAVGDNLLELLRPNESFTFQPIQQESYQYGRDYFVGDLVTTRYQAVERNVQITLVNIVVENGKESIRIGTRVVT